MKRQLAFLVLAALSANAGGDVVDVTPQRARAVAAINWTDDTGRSRQLSEFAGYPLILLPIYTRCRGACVQDVNRLKQALADSSGDPRQFRVLLFSFDVADTPTVLTRYREREKVPLGWSVGAASQANIDALLDSVGVQVGKSGSEFTHPNIVLFLDPNLRVARWIYGTDYSNGDLELALQVANGRSDWIGRHSDVLYALLLFSASVLCVVLANYVRQLNGLRRLRGHRDVIADA